MAPGRLTVHQWMLGHEYTSSTNWTWPVIKTLKANTKLGGAGERTNPQRVGGKKRGEYDQMHPIHV